MILYIAAGILAGVISGMGIGGGILLIPVLLFWGDMGQKEAQMVNLIYFLPTAVVALIQHFKAGRIEKPVLKPLLIGGLAGAAAGSLLAIRMKPQWLGWMYGVFLILMGLMEIYKGYRMKKA